MKLSTGLVLAAISGTASPASGQGVDVPLELWTNAAFPNGLTIGLTNGVSFGDYDADGFPDLLALHGGLLWRNLAGESWELGADLSLLLPPSEQRYGASFGDYNNDGLPDIGCEPRDVDGDSCFRLLRNVDGTGAFQEVAGNPQVVDVDICEANSETICWGDVDGDGNLDMFLPIYPTFSCGSLSGPGNAFLYNLGPGGHGGPYRFTEMASAAGLENPLGTCRPEGAQFADIDHDGDFDLYSNGAMYRNVSAPGSPLFDVTSETAGIYFSHEKDEGVVFFDKDMDGDFDLLVVYVNAAIGARVYESHGDGSFSLLPQAMLEGHALGIRLGASAADWDNDGDIDLTTRHVFRRNMFAETGVASFVVAEHAIPEEHLDNVTPAWADWDKDGDLDCALGNWWGEGFLYDNALYDDTTSEDGRRFVRIRALRDSHSVPGGLETEYGAVVEIHVAGEENGPRRRSFVTSSAGYLTQNEYTLHFGLPPDPAPADPSVDLLFDVSVDFPETIAGGIVRVDEHVNPILGGISLALLQDREISVFRSGRVVFEDRIFQPTVAPGALSTPALALTSPEAALPAPVAAPGPDHYVGIELDTSAAEAPVRVVEIVLDGQLDTSVDCGGSTANVTLWDVTDPTRPAIVSNGSFESVTPATNRRSTIRTNVLLDPGRVFRLVARVTALRTSAASLPLPTGPVRTTGGASFQDRDPCTGNGVVAATFDPSLVPMALRFRADAGTPFVDLGFGVAGTDGVPTLSGAGDLTPGSAVQIDLTDALASSQATLVVGYAAEVQPLLGGVGVPSADVFVAIPVDATGSATLSGTWPAALLPSASLFLQCLVADPEAPSGVALSNALVGTTQP